MHNYRGKADDTEVFDKRPKRNKNGRDRMALALLRKAPPLPQRAQDKMKLRVSSPEEQERGNVGLDHTKAIGRGLSDAGTDEGKAQTRELSVDWLNASPQLSYSSDLQQEVPPNCTALFSSIACDEPCKVSMTSSIKNRLMSTMRSEKRMKLRPVKIQRNYVRPDGVEDDDCLYDTAREVVTSTPFDLFFGMLIIGNAVIIYCYVDEMAASSSTVVPKWARTAECLLLAVFGVELSLRLYVYRYMFFLGYLWQWNMFDVGCWLLQLLEQSFLSMMVDWTGSCLVFNLIRVLRFLRVVRLARSQRVMEYAAELNTFIVALLSSLRAFMYAMMLMFSMIIGFALFLTQLVLHYRFNPDTLLLKGPDDGIAEDSEDLSSLTKHYGSVSKSTLTLFGSISGGNDWIDLAEPLGKNISPAVFLLFGLYICFAIYAFANVITGVFVESALEVAKKDQDNHIMNMVYHSFAGADLDDNNLISIDEFKNVMSSPWMEKYFKFIDVDPSEAASIFRLLDVDGFGSIPAEDFLSGAVRLRGNARSLDLAMMVHDNHRFYEKYQRHALYMGRQIEEIRRHLAHEAPLAAGASKTALPLSKTPDHSPGKAPEKSSDKRHVPKVAAKGIATAACTSADTAATAAAALTSAVAPAGRPLAAAAMPPSPLSVAASLPVPSLRGFVAALDKLKGLSPRGRPPAAAGQLLPAVTAPDLQETE